MSDLFVDNIKHQSSQGSGTITIGASGETISIPSGATLTVPNGGLTGQNYPAFEARLDNNQTISNATTTIVIFDTEVFDTDSCYDNTTNYRFTPTVAGYYAVNIGAYVVNNTRLLLNVYKNGALYEIVHDSSISESIVRINGSNLMYLNGTTDYIEAWVYIGGTTLEVRHPTLNGTKFEAYLVRAA